MPSNKIRGLRASRIALVAGFASLSAACAIAGCSSNERPSELGACESTTGLPCASPVSVGRSAPQGDGGQPSIGAGATVVAEAGACPGASQIFGATNAIVSTTCVTCVAANCCESAASCPNDPVCLSIATCVVTQCLANDVSCLPTCEGAAPTGAVTEYIDFQQCVGQSCPGCPLVSAVTGL